ncbi:inner membrane protein [Caldimonas brevitalea]|uniref:Inner membrane protein n=2 Tax=Caldimonas brevitalea TaxID=413882 RepID=A0A0G3BQ18_9BURK|nr:inner membrane protein [Caldimonas brevitalea]
MWIAWPAFLVAGVTEMLVFAVVDPDDLRGLGGESLALSRSAIYTLAFFAFWALCALSSALTTLLSASPFETQRCPMPPDARPRECVKEGPAAR